MAALERSSFRHVDKTSRFLLLDGWINKAIALRCIELLDRHMFSSLQLEAQRIPSSSITSMRKNYSEVLPKTMNVLTTVLDRPRSRAMRTAYAIGLVDLLGSPALHRLAEAATGLRLDDQPGMQVLLYEHGHYAGPHNDHHPEFAETRDGFVDVHLSLANSAVAHQWLVYESRGHLSEIARVSALGAISVYWLPFWHYTTPLVGKHGRQGEARRWVLLASYTIA